MKTNDTKTEITIGKGQMIQINRLHDSTGSKESTIQINHPLITHDEIVGYDSCGWPLYPLRIISLLRAIGMSDDIIDQIPEDILTSTITTLEDEKQSPDGELHGSKQSQSSIGYGINEECIVNCAINKNKNIVYLWRMPLTSVNNAN